jgi:uncharacterized protein
MPEPGAQAMIGFGQVRHTRLRPARNAFAYPTYFLMLPMRSLQTSGSGALARNRFAPISFYDQDHGDGRANALQWLDELLAQEGIEGATGEVWLHCYPRVFGYTFKPVSFWYCHGKDGSLQAIVVEVNNTFGEKHVYVLDKAQLGAEIKADKVFHVSPFCQIEGQYRFRFMFSADRDRTVARIDYDDTLGALIQTAVSGRLQTLDAKAVKTALLSYGFMTLAVIARIHWQAAKLYFKRIPFVSKPAPSATWVTRSTS